MFDYRPNGLDCGYSENGGPWLPLDPISRTYTRSYPVQQLQSVLTANR